MTRASAPELKADLALAVPRPIQSQLTLKRTDIVTADNFLIPMRQETGNGAIRIKTAPIPRADTLNQWMPDGSALARISIWKAFWGKEKLVHDH